jgi:hypothetical protein
MAMRVAGGSLNGRASLRRDGANAALSGRVSFDSLVVDKAGLSAKLSGGIDFADTGQSPNALISGLAGSGHIQTSAAQLPKLDPDALPRVIDKAKTDGFNVENVDLNRLLGDEMDRHPMSIVDADAPVSISAGMMRIGSLEASHSSGAAKVQTSFDLRSLALDVDATVAEKQAPKFWSGAPPAIGVSLRGRVDALTRDIDSANLANGLEAQAIARETERITEFEADIRERAAFNRRLKASRSMRQREFELEAFAVEQARVKLQADRRRVEEAAIKANDEVRAEEARAVEEARKAEETRKAEEDARKVNTQPIAPPLPPQLPAPTDLAPTALQPTAKPPRGLDPSSNGIY